MIKQEIAILVVEFQKTWTQDSFFHSLIKKNYEARKVLKNSIDLLNTARQHGVNIIQSPFIIDKRDQASYSKIPFLPKLLGQFTAETWRAEYTDGIFQKGDYEVKGRTAFDNTIDSNLVEILNELDIKTVYIIGFTTDHCVAETMESLTNLGFKTILVSDATATIFHSTQVKMENKYHSIGSEKLRNVITSCSGN
jgi:nicotinamidase-related amidase